MDQSDADDLEFCVSEEEQDSNPYIQFVQQIYTLTHRYTIWPTRLALRPYLDSFLSTSNGRTVPTKLYTCRATSSPKLQLPALFSELAAFLSLAFAYLDSLVRLFRSLSSRRRICCSIIKWNASSKVSNGSCEGACALVGDSLGSPGEASLQRFRM